MPLSAMNSRTGRLVIDTGCMYSFMTRLPDPACGREI
jgi:hypothetical protein